METSEIKTIPSDNLMEKYHEMYSMYKDTDKFGIVREAEFLILDKKNSEAMTLLETLEGKDALLNKLFEHLKGKSVHDTLKKLTEGKCHNLYKGLKGLFSLGTHLCIELEKGHKEYKCLLEDVLASINRQMI